MKEQTCQACFNKQTTLPCMVCSGDGTMRDGMPVPKRLSGDGMFSPDTMECLAMVETADGTYKKQNRNGKRRKGDRIIPKGATR